MTFVLSIETDAGTYQHSYHLGTIEKVARQEAETIFHHRDPKIGTRIVTVALLLNGKIFAVFDGSWSDDEWYETPNEGE